jgi:hypothetical protein
MKGWTSSDVLALQRKRGMAASEILPVIKHTARGDKMNKSEAMALLILRAKYPDAVIFFHSIKLEIGEGAWYWPDFVVTWGDSRPIVIVEVKSPHRWQEKGRLKFRAAKLRFKCFRWLWMMNDKGAWTYEGEGA